jgi:hypothetical protein
MSYIGHSLLWTDMLLPQYRPLTVRQSSTRGTATAPQGHNMSAQGKQPRAPRQATPSVFGSPHARPRLRSPGLRIAHSTPSPERAQQMADQINADWQTGSIGDQNECGTTSHRVVGRASCSVQRVGNRHIGPWRLLRPFRAVGNVFVGNPGRRERSQDSRSLALGCHVAAPSGRSAVARRFAV